MSTLPSDGADQRELMFFALALAAIVALVLFLSDGGILFNRPLWVDEWLVVFVANRPSPFAAIGDLSAGVDGGAALFHLGFWFLRSVLGPLSPTTMRMVSFLCVMGALVLVYATLRRRFGKDASVVGALAVGSSQLVVAHTYEARFYGPWLLCGAWFAWMLSRRQQPNRSRRTALLLGLSAVLLCTVHFYGIITLGLMTTGVVASYGSRWREGLRVVAPAAAGLLTMVIVVPLAFAQREAYSVPSWIPDFSLAQLRAMTRQFWLTAVPLTAAVGLIVAMLLGARRDGGVGNAIVARRATEDAGVVALFSLALIPLALALLSLLGQPSMLDRYAITTILAWAPWTAAAFELLGRWTARVFRVVLVGLWFVSYTAETEIKRRFAFEVQHSTSVFQRALTAGAPVIFQSMYVMYPVLGTELDHPRTAFLEIPDSTFSALFPDRAPIGQVNRISRLERDLARAHNGRWGFPQLASLSALDTTRRFLLLAPEGRLPAGLSRLDQYAKTMFPRHAFTRLLPDLALLERAPADSMSK